MLAYAVDDEDVQQWVPEEHGPMPKDLKGMLTDPGYRKFAWNSSFEYQIFQNTLGMHIPHSEWYDPMVLSFSLSLPGKLEKAGEVVGLSEEKKKMAKGKALMRKFSKPRKPTKNKPYNRIFWWMEPEEWEHYKEYNRGDVVAERAIYKKLRKFDLPVHEWEMWQLDQAINQAGIPINLDLVNNAVRVYEYLMEKKMAEMRRITGLENPGSNAQILPWLQENGYPYEDVQAPHIKAASAYFKERPDHWDEDRWYNYIQNIELQRILELRLETAKASPKKYYALQRGTDQEAGVLRNAVQFAGAGRTWRWAGRMFQAQNLPRPVKYLEKKMPEAIHHLNHMTGPSVEQIYDQPLDLLTSCIRPCAQAPKGKTFIDADLNAIENRVLGWMSACVKILQVFEKNRDPYVDFATYLFGGKYEDLIAEYKGGNGFKRTISKPGVLGCGYRLGPGEKRTNRRTGEIEGTGLLGYAWNMGITQFTEEQAKLSVETFRREFEEVVEFWYAIEKASKKCVRTGKPVECGPVTFDMKSPFLRMRLPSNRYLHYCRPRIEDVKTPWGQVKPTLTYEGLDSRSQWSRIATHGGKLTENADQAISRDILANGMRLAHREGIDIRLHVHDQIIGLVDENEAEDKLEILKQCMAEPMPWAPDIPLSAEGFISPIFIKD